MNPGLKFAMKNSAVGSNFIHVANHRFAQICVKHSASVLRFRQCNNSSFDFLEAQNCLMQSDPNYHHTKKADIKLCEFTILFNPNKTKNWLTYKYLGFRYRYIKVNTCGPLSKVSS